MADEVTHAGDVTRTSAPADFEATVRHFRDVMTSTVPAWERRLAAELARTVWW